MNLTEKVRRMTDEAFEVWMKRNGYTGHAAVALAAKRRAAIEKHKAKQPARAT